MGSGVVTATFEKKDALPNISSGGQGGGLAVAISPIFSTITEVFECFGAYVLRLCELLHFQVHCTQQLVFCKALSVCMNPIRLNEVKH